MQLSLLRNQLLASKQRVLLHLQGELEWAVNWLQGQLNDLTPNLSLVWFGEQSNKHQQDPNVAQQLDVRLKQYKKFLGQERDLVIINAYSGFNPDALGALAGIVKLGGICVLLTPENEAWASYADPELTRICTEPYTIEALKPFYLSRLAELMTGSEVVAKFSQTQSYLPSFNDRSTHSPTGQQKLLTEHLYAQLVSPKKNEYLGIVIADRGRGKTSALGLLSANLLRANDDIKRICVTAPLNDAVETLFHHAEQGLILKGIKVQRQGNKLLSERGELQFIAPDQLMQFDSNADVLLIDEAAAIPAQMLKPVLSPTRHKKVILATTIQGYEGTGRGFEYKLKPYIYDTYSEVESHQLDQPIRWCQGDYLEQSVNQLLALDAQLPEVQLTEHELPIKSTHFKHWTAEQLHNNEAKLRQIFALLVNAHYRTTPTDLRQILDGPDMHLVTLESNGVSVAAALLGKEGMLDRALCEQIWQGRRRPRGHLFPQSLLAHSGIEKAGQYLYYRVIRIATHPELQRKGLGSQLLLQVQAWCQSKGADFLCTSFGYEAQLAEFWQRAQFNCVRLGLKAEASTGEYSMLMLKALHNKVQPFLTAIHQRYLSTLAIECQHPIRNKAMAEKIKDNKNNDISNTLSSQDWFDLNAFAHHFRSVNSCLLAMTRFVYTSLNDSDKPQQLPDIVRDKIIHRHSDKALIEKYQLAGEKALVSLLRETWRTLLAEVK